MANNNSHQGELFELTQSDAIKRAAFEASNRSYKSLQEVLNSYSLIEDNMKSNFIVCMNYVTKNGLILSIAPEEVRDNLPLALVAITNNKKSYEYVSENLQKNKAKINEKNLQKYLQTRDIPDPDLLIRTGNTKRLSNFLLWQLAYSEIFFEKKLWPEFNEKDYNKIIKNYKRIKRNFGKI